MHSAQYSVEYSTVQCIIHYSTVQSITVGLYSTVQYAVQYAVQYILCSIYTIRYSVHSDDSVQYSMQCSNFRTVYCTVLSVYFMSILYTVLYGATL